MTHANVLRDVTVASGAAAVSLTENEAISIAAITREPMEILLGAVEANAISQSGVIPVDDGVGLPDWRSDHIEFAANVLGDVTVAVEPVLSLTENEAISIAAITRTDGDLL